MNVNKELKVRISNLLKQREALKVKFVRYNLLKTTDVENKSFDHHFLDNLISLIEKNLTNKPFSVQVILKELAISRTQLHRKLKALVDQSANEFIQSVRLQKASELLKDKTAIVSEVAFMVGYSSPSYFSRLFKQRFGHSPSEH